MKGLLYSMTVLLTIGIVTAELSAQSSSPRFHFYEGNNEKVSISEVSVFQEIDGRPTFVAKLKNGKFPHGKELTNTESGMIILYFANPEYEIVRRIFKINEINTDEPIKVSMIHKTQEIILGFKLSTSSDLLDADDFDIVIKVDGVAKRFKESSDLLNDDNDFELLHVFESKPGKSEFIVEIVGTYKGKNVTFGEIPEATNAKVVNISMHSGDLRSFVLHYPRPVPVNISVEDDFGPFVGIKLISDKANIADHFIEDPKNSGKHRGSIWAIEGSRIKIDFRAKLAGRDRLIKSKYFKVTNGLVNARVILKSPVNIRIRVVDSENKPMEGLKLRIKSRSGSKIKFTNKSGREVSTDKTGVLNGLLLLKKGDYILQTNIESTIKVSESHKLFTVNSRSIEKDIIVDKIYRGLIKTVSSDDMKQPAANIRIQFSGSVPSSWNGITSVGGILALEGKNLTRTDFEFNWFNEDNNQSSSQPIEINISVRKNPKPVVVTVPVIRNYLLQPIIISSNGTEIPGKVLIEEVGGKGEKLVNAGDTVKLEKWIRVRLTPQPDYQDGEIIWKITPKISRIPASKDVVIINLKVSKDINRMIRRELRRENLYGINELLSELDSDIYLKEIYNKEYYFGELVSAIYKSFYSLSDALKNEIYEKRIQFIQGNPGELAIDANRNYRKIYIYLFMYYYNVLEGTIRNGPNIDPIISEIYGYDINFFINNFTGIGGPRQEFPILGTDISIGWIFKIYYDIVIKPSIDNTPLYDKVLKNARLNYNDRIKPNLTRIEKLNGYEVVKRCLNDIQNIL